MNDRRKSLQVGDLVGGKYQLLKKIGEGGNGRVYRAINVLLGREVAIKVLQPELVGDETSKKRFFREAKTANRIRHPNIVDVLDVGDSDEGPWMVQELLVGESLSALLVRERSLSVERTIELLLPALSALAAAHAQGIAHRDFKPENIFLVRGDSDVPTAKVLDFGLSKNTVRFGAVRESDNITATGAIIGTPAYLSPERARTESNGDVRGDVWAIGVVLYECTSGKLPFAATNVRDMFVRICRGDVIPLEEASPSVDGAFASIVMHCIAYEPEDRYASAAEVVEELRRYIDGARTEDRVAQRTAPAPATPLRVDPSADELLATGDAPPANTTNELFETPLAVETAPRPSAPGAGSSGDVKDDAAGRVARAATNANRSLLVLLAMAVIALVVQWRAYRPSERTQPAAAASAPTASVGARTDTARADASFATAEDVVDASDDVSDRRAD